MREFIRLVLRSPVRSVSTETEMAPDRFTEKLAGRTEMGPARGPGESLANLNVEGSTGGGE